MPDTLARQTLVQFNGRVCDQRQYVAVRLEREETREWGQKGDGLRWEIEGGARKECPGLLDGELCFRSAMCVILWAHR